MEARKFSRKRAAILEALRGTHEHPSAEMLYARLKSEFPDLSLGTVYRNLAMFVADGRRGQRGHGRRAGAVRRGHGSACAFHMQRLRPGPGRLLAQPRGP